MQYEIVFYKVDHKTHSYYTQIEHLVESCFVFVFFLNSFFQFQFKKIQKFNLVDILLYGIYNV